MSRNERGGQRRLSRPTLILLDEQCPGLLDFLDALPTRTETAFYRGLIYAWYLLHKEEDTLDEAMRAAIATGLTAQAGNPVVSRAIFPSGQGLPPAIAERPSSGVARKASTANLETTSESIDHDKGDPDDSGDPSLSTDFLFEGQALGVF